MLSELQASELTDPSKVASREFLVELAAAR